MSNNLVDDLENSFQACLAPITNPLSSHVLDNDELKANVDNIQRFLDISQQIESFFIRKRAILCEQKPESVLNEDYNELKSEIIRKDNLLTHYHERLNTWSNIVKETLDGKHQPGVNPMKMENPNQMMPNQMASQMRMAPAGIMSQMAPQGHMQHAPNPMMRSRTGGMVPSPVPMGPTSQHPATVFNPNMNNSMQSPGPLAYLEQTTAHIGMNDNRR